MTKLAEIQDAILSLPSTERSELRDWLLGQEGFVANPEENTPELERELLKGVRSEHSPYSSIEMREICERVLQEHRVRRAG